MRINNIKVENFQSYFEETTFEFTTGVNLVLGMNAGGKSSLFNAFYWVLFDDVYETDSGWGNLGVRFFNAKAQDLLKEQEEGKLSVSLSINALNYIDRDPANIVEYTFYKKVIFKRSNGNVLLDRTEDLSISFKNEFGETIRIDDREIDKCIEFLLPDAIRKYIWFQGETISNLIDFNNSRTLNNAINKISYFPHYKSISNIIGEVIRLSEKDINIHIRKSNTNSTKLKNITAEIEANHYKLKKESENLEKHTQNKEDLKQSLSEVRVEMTGISDHQEFSDRMKSLNEEENSLISSLEEKEQSQRETIINKWMLKGIDPLIESSSEKINKFIKEIRDKSENDNPIPIDVPGSIYIQEMLNDKRCHICLRDAPEGSQAYKDLEKKLESSALRKKEYDEKEKEFRALEENFTSLVNLPDDILNHISQISDEIKDFYTTHDEKLNRRKEIFDEKRQILDEVGIKDASKLTSNVTLLRQKLQKQQNLNHDLRQIDSLIKDVSTRVNRLRVSTKSLEDARDSFDDKSNSIPQQIAKPYVVALEIISKKLEEVAKENLISEIECKSTELLHGYLEASLSYKGFIKIDRDNYDVQVVDSDGIMVPINAGNLTAAKMSVINSILFLSSKKLQRDYPMISDAPSSVFDFKNTKSYMNKVGDTFPQVIIMTKDIYDMSIQDLKSINNVNRVYKLVNKKINDKIKKESISNYCTISGAPII